MLIRTHRALVVLFFCVAAACGRTELVPPGVVRVETCADRWSADCRRLQ